MTDALSIILITATVFIAAVCIDWRVGGGR